jgi:hypothetical protein
VGKLRKLNYFLTLAFMTLPTLSFAQNAGDLFGRIIDSKYTVAPKLYRARGDAVEIKYFTDLYFGDKISLPPNSVVNISRAGKKITVHGTTTWSTYTIPQNSNNLSNFGKDLLKTIRFAPLPKGESMNIELATRGDCKEKQKKCLRSKDLLPSEMLKSKKQFISTDTQYIGLFWNGHVDQLLVYDASNTLIAKFQPWGNQWLVIKLSPNFGKIFVIRDETGKLKWEFQLVEKLPQLAGVSLPNSLSDEDKFAYSVALLQKGHTDWTAFAFGQIYARRNEVEIATELWDTLLKRGTIADYLEE